MTGKWMGEGVRLPRLETFAKLSGFPRSRGKCPKDKGGRCRMIKPKTPRKRVLQRSRLAAGISEGPIELNLPLHVLSPVRDYES